MANKDLLKQAIAEAKSVREAAIANAKEALEETLTPHLKDMLAAKLQEMEDENIEEEVIDETTSGFEAVAEAEEEEVEDESEESEDEAGHEAEESEEEEAAEDEEVEGDEDLGDLSVDQFKDMIRDIIAQELGAAEGGEEEMGMDMDAGDVEGMGDEDTMEEPVEDIPSPDEEEMSDDDDTINLDELLRELEEDSEEVSMNEALSPDMIEFLGGLVGAGGIIASSAIISKQMDKALAGEYGETVQDLAKKLQSAGKSAGDVVRRDLDEALSTINTLRKDLQEVNILNSKLLYVNKIFKANNLTESQKVNIIAAFDRAETVKEVKLVFNTVSESIVSTKNKVNENVSKVRGMASKATGTTASKPEVISEVSDAVRRMQKLAGIIK